MKKLTNKERCKKCVHKKVCEYQSYFINTEGVDRCNNYSPKANKGYRKQSEYEWIVCGMFDDFFKCSSCGDKHPIQTAIEYKYCPNCGAKMKGE